MIIDGSLDVHLGNTPEEMINGKGWPTRDPLRRRPWYPPKAGLTMLQTHNHRK